MNELAKNLKSILNKKGFNLFRIIESDEYDKLSTDSKRTKHILNNCESIIITGFMGNKYWNILMEFISHNPGFSTQTDEIIDEYSRYVLNETSQLITPYTSKFKIVYPFGNSVKQIDFTTLGLLSGTGVKSILGLLINPVYGTWISFRGAILTDLKFDKYNRSIKNFNPCTLCSKPCISACPAGTVTDKGWNWNKCLDFRSSDETCDTNCYSRRACPYGHNHQYSNEQFLHHHKSVLKNYLNRVNASNGK